MLLTTHTLVGVAIVSNIGQPALALPLAFLSHFAVDLTPHRDFFSFSEYPNASIEEKRRIFKIIGLDFLFGLILALFFVFRAFPDMEMAKVIILGAFLANLPDGLELPYLLGKSYPGLPKLLKIQSRLQVKTNLILGSLIQILIAMIGFFASL